MVRAFFPQGGNNDIVTNTNFPPQSSEENDNISLFFESFSNVVDGTGKVQFDNIPQGTGNVLIEEAD